MRFLLSVLFVISLCQLSAQSSDSRKALIEATNLMRLHLLDGFDDKEAMEEMQLRWESAESDTEVLGYIFSNISFTAELYTPGLKNVKKKIIKYAPGSTLYEVITKEDLELIERNTVLESFIRDGYLEDEYPFKVTLDSTDVHMLEFIDAQPGDVIADIGTGTGNKALILSLVYKENDFVFNELKKRNVKIVKKKLEEYKELFYEGDRTIEVVKGKKSSAKLGREVDVIVVRNTFHHFSDKSGMLQDLKKHLADDGRVIFIEPLAKKVPEVGDCLETLEYEVFMEYINKENFKILKEEQVEDILLLKCSK